MALSEKNGGPYTKAEQEKRRNQVYEMHFEKSQSASSIAEELGINRNTINDDIKYWYSELAAEFNELDVKNLMLRQHARMELQRTRLIGRLEKEENITIILKIERMIFDLDCTIMKMIAPIAAMHAQDIPEQIATQTITHLLECDNVGKLTGYSETALLRDIIEYKKCDVSYAQKILHKIKALGLDLFQDQGYSMTIKNYDMLGFAESKKILSDEKLEAVYAKIEQTTKQQEQELEQMKLKKNRIEGQFVEKYGDQSKWTEEIWDKYNDAVDFL